MAWHPMKPETIERRTRERAEARKRETASLIARINAEIEKWEALGDHEWAQWHRDRLKNIG